jgi:ubiquitin-activating enzyme E1 C
MGGKNWYISEIIFGSSLLSFRQLKKPSLNGPNGPLFYQAPASLRQSTLGNLEKTLKQLSLSNGDEISVTDSALPFQLSLVIRFAS